VQLSLEAGAPLRRTGAFPWGRPRRAQRRPAAAPDDRPGRRTAAAPAPAARLRAPVRWWGQYRRTGSPSCRWSSPVRRSLPSSCRERCPASV